MTAPRVAAFSLIASELGALPKMLRTAFGHSWVTSYQVGFGPPLIRSSDRLAERLKGARSALDKLDAYLEVCFLDPEERGRLALLHRRLLTRRHGPMEAEALNSASADVFDLSLRLYDPQDAPEAVRQEMLEEGVALELIPDGQPPEHRNARISLHLDDPRGERLLFVDEVAQRVKDETSAVALELRTPITARPLYVAWLERFARHTEFDAVDLGEPRAYARVSRDGARS